MAKRCHYEIIKKRTELFFAENSHTKLKSLRDSLDLAEKFFSGRFSANIITKQRKYLTRAFNNRFATTITKTTTAIRTTVES